MQERDFDDTVASGDETTAPATDGGGTVPATADTKLVNPFALFAQRNRGGGFFKGDLIKLDHVGGSFLRVRGETKTPIEDGEQFVVNVHELTDSWSKFVGGKLIERRVYRAANGEMAPTREELGDTDEDEWPTRNNRPKDPWQRQVFLPMKGDDGEVVAFSATGQSAIGEIAELVGMFASADRHGKFPVVELETRFFESQHGSKIYVPVFKLVDWQFWEPDKPAPPVPSVPVPTAPPPRPAITKHEADADTDDMSGTTPARKAVGKRGDMNDEIPF